MFGQVRALIKMFAERSADRSTLDALYAMFGNRRIWRDANSLFQRVRQKTLVAEQNGDQLMGTQYLFEEMCAKALYNFSGEDAPFDPDAQFWVIPAALTLSRRLWHR